MHVAVKFLCSDTHTFEVTAVERVPLVVDRCYLVCDWLPQLLHLTSACGSQILCPCHVYMYVCMYVNGVTRDGDCYVFVHDFTW